MPPLSRAQFHSVRVPAQEHTDAVAAAQASNPEKNWTVSPPEEGSQSFAVRDQAGKTHGYYDVAKTGKKYERYLGGLVNTSGAKGVGSYVVGRVQHGDVKLDAFSGPLEGYYKEHGFETTGRMKFDDQYAPDAWKPEYGRSDVVDMASKRKEDSGKPPAIKWAAG